MHLATVTEMIVRRENATLRAVLHNALGTLGANGVHALPNLPVKSEFRTEAVNVSESLDVTALDLLRNLNSAVD